MITKELIEFGLGEKEAKAYLALLELEVAGVSEVAKTAGINRSSAYVTLESLKKKGLVSISDQKKVRQYIATPPEVILRDAEDRAVKQDLVKKKIEAILPDMKALYKGTKKKPIVRVFEGKEGLISAFEDTLNTKEKLMRVASSPGNLNHILSDYLYNYITKRFHLGIKMHGIHPDDQMHREIVKNTPKNFDIPILIPVSKFKFPADMAIYDDRIGFMSPLDGGIALIIESKEISNIMKNLFDLAFEEATRLNSTIKEKEKKQKK